MAPGIMAPGMIQTQPYYNVELIPSQTSIVQGGTVRFEAIDYKNGIKRGKDESWFDWLPVDNIKFDFDKGQENGPFCRWNTENVEPGCYLIRVNISDRISGVGGQYLERATAAITIMPKCLPESDKPALISLQRTKEEPTQSMVLWAIIRSGAKGIFTRYKKEIDCYIEAAIKPHLSEIEANIPYDDPRDVKDDPNKGKKTDSMGRAFLQSVNGYDQLKRWTDEFLQTNVPFSPDIEKVKEELKLQGVSKDDIETFCQNYFKDVGAGSTPYLDSRADAIELTRGKYLRKRLDSIALQELIWSYWHEESMLVQAMNKISLRFQNRSENSAKDPLRHLDIDPLRPLNNILWGYIQDEPHRLTIARRAYEYDHHYGIRLMGRAVPKISSADSRSKFIEAFHNLLYICTQYYKELDDTTIYADAFPLRNALREVHILLAEGAHNQYGDLPWTARREMLIQQWILARQEMREFLRGRIMVPYEEEWMGTLDAMKKLQGWNDVNSTHFHNLAVWGEQILLSIRHDNWNDSTRAAPDAANWAAFWRNEIQGYIHAYRSATGADLTLASGTGSVDCTMPSVHLQRRLAKAA